MVRIAVKPLKAPRRNPSRSVGAVLVNGRGRRRRVTKRRNTSAKRLLSLLRKNRGGKRRYARNPVIVNRKHRRASTRKRRNAGTRARRAAPRSFLRMNKSRMNRAYKVKANRSRSRSRRRVHAHRRNPVIVNRRRNPVIVNRKRKNSHKRHTHRRSTAMRLFRNPSLPMGLGGIPIVGPFLGTMVASLASAGFGAVAMYPVTKGVTYVERFMPHVRADAAFAVAGFILAGLVGAANKVTKGKIPYAKEMSVALATSGSAIAAYKWYTGAGGATVAEEKAGLYAGEFAGYAGAEALGWPGDIAVIPMSQQAYGLSRNDIAAAQAVKSDYHDTSWGDADLGVMGGTYAMTQSEREAALAGPAAWRASFPVMRGGGGASGMLQRGFRPGGARVSQHAGQPGHRFGWLIDAIGFDRFQKFAALSPSAQEAAVPRMIAEFQATFDRTTSPPPDEPALAGYGAYGANVWAA